MGQFLSDLSELRFKDGGFEASATRRLDLDETSQRLHDFWKPGGKIDRSNATGIAAAMRELDIVGSVAWLINAAAPQDRKRVAAHPSLEPHPLRFDRPRVVIAGLDPAISCRFEPDNRVKPGHDELRVRFDPIGYRF